ncbi:MAG: FAD-dependent oxidoreductase, partial [Pseudomonadota bacterium]
WPLMNADDVIGAVWSPDDGRVSPSDLCAALAKGARARGAKIFEDTGVSGIRTEGGRIAGVETTRGTVRCDAVALCTGLWSRAAASMAGAVVPVWACEHFYLLTNPVDGISGNMPTLSDHDNHLYIRDDSGGLLVGCFEPIGKPVDPGQLGDDFAFQLLPEDWDHFEPMMLNAMRRLPILEQAGVRMLLNGPESFTPDGSFLLGETAETRGLFLGCGMNSVGIATAGGAGMALAQAIVDGSPPMDLHEADPKRFPDCLNSADALAARAPEVLGRHYEITYPGRRWSTARGLRHTPLDMQWRSAQACFGQVFGWERPLYFGADAEPELTFARPAWFDQVGAEVAHAHERVAVFDQSTLGKIDVRGPDACHFLNRVCANDMDRSPGRAIYTTMLNASGGIESDLTVHRLTEDHYRLFVGTAAVRRDLSWLRCHLDGERIEITDVTADFATLAVVGPNSADVARAVGATDLLDLGYFRTAVTEIAGVPVLAARLSYVGEAGWEITCPADQAATLYEALAADGVAPAGAYAQTSMRIEKKFLAFGHDIGTDVTPLDAGLAFAIGWDTPFIGRDAILRQRDSGARTRIAAIKFDDVIANPISGEPVICDGKIVGKTTSASYGYRVAAPVAIAEFDHSDACVDGASVRVDIAGVETTGVVTLAAPFDPEGTRMRSIRPR